MTKCTRLMNASILALAAGCVLMAAPVEGKVKQVRVQVWADSDAGGYDAARAMDGDPGTMWHTAFIGSTPKHPHTLTVDLGGPRDLTGFTYLPRAGGGNGTIKNFEFYVSDKKYDLGAPVIKGKFKAIGHTQTIHFGEAVTGRYVQLRALDEVNGQPWSSVAELELLSEGLAFRSVVKKSRPPVPAARKRRATPAPASVPVVAGLEGELHRQYVMLLHDLGRRARFQQLAAETFDRQSLILETDRDPLDIVLRRTAALLKDISQKPKAPDLSDEADRLAALTKQAVSVDVKNVDARAALYVDVCKLRRKIAFANPLLNFDKLLFIRRNLSSFAHMCDQYYGSTQRPGGGICVLTDPFGPNPQVRDILADSVVQSGRLKGQKLTGGSFLSPDLSFDGKRLAFAWVECKGSRGHLHHLEHEKGHWDPGYSYNVFSANIDGTDLKMLTDGGFNDFDPCFMPSGRIAFITERRGGYLRCGRACPTYTLYDMAPDGSDIRCLSPHETNEWHPSVTNEGMIVWTRWDYVDRHGVTAHMPWLTTPDGRNPRAVHGNYAPRRTRPDMEQDVRAIPGSHRFVATAAPHHHQSYGSLVVIDPTEPDDNSMGPVKRLTPRAEFPESQGPTGQLSYGQAWPLSEDYYLCVYEPYEVKQLKPQGKHAIYLLDRFGNQELIYRDPNIACHNPIPLRARPTPPIVPDGSQRVAKGEPAEATVSVVDVYDSRKPWPEGTEIKALRVYQIMPLPMACVKIPHATGIQVSQANDSINLARSVLGTVPVEEDGSAHFIVPAGKELYFQALDEDGLAVTSMRSSTHFQPNEKAACQGCHEPTRQVPASVTTQMPLAMRRPPSRLKPDVDGTNPFSYPRLVQPVLEKNCVGCHKENADKAPRLDAGIVQGRGVHGCRTTSYYASYMSLTPKYGFYNYGGGWNDDSFYRTTPGKFGARASKLYELLKAGHHDVELSDEDMHRITVWLDSVSLFYGVYEAEGGKAQLRGEIAHPTLE